MSHSVQNNCYFCELKIRADDKRCLFNLIFMKYAFLYFLMLFAAFGASARDAGSFFTDAGADAAFPELTQLNRMDMMDYFRAGQVRDITNYYDGSARMVRADSAVVTVQTARGCVVDLYVIADRKDTTLMVVETLSLPQKDSRVKFYNADWQPIATIVLPAYTLSDWLTEAGRKSRAEVERRIPFVLAVASFNPETGVLCLTNTLEGYFPDEDDKAFVAEMVRKSLLFRWNKGKFKLQK